MPQHLQTIAPLLSIQKLTIALPQGADRPHAVQDVSFDLHRGEILCVVGESGSGKSMSANAIMGLLPPNLVPQSGRILFQGRDLLQQDEATLLAMRGKDMAMVFQEPLSALNPLMTVGEQIAEVMRVHCSHEPDACERRVLELLEFVGLPDPVTLRHSYPSVTARTGDCIRSAVKIESGAKSALDPHTSATVVPCVAGDLPGLDLKGANIGTVRPERTSWDRIIILHGQWQWYDRRGVLRHVG